MSLLNLDLEVTCLARGYAFVSTAHAPLRR